MMAKWHNPRLSQTQVEEFIDEVKRRTAWKSALRKANVEASSSDGSRPDEAELRKLDSSLKKNTAFIRKLVRRKCL